MADIDTNETPASKEYWENFYSAGPGINEYEWYNFGAKDLLKTSFLDNFHERDSILQIGVGNSTIMEELMEHPLFPKNITIVNIDISETAIFSMKSAQDKLEHEITNQKKRYASIISKIIMLIHF
jgi:hypothetical protein